MSRYLEENALIEHLTQMLLKTAVNNEGYKTYASNVYRDIAVNRLSVWLESAPTADVVEAPGDYNGYKDIDGTVKKTRWQQTIDTGFKMYICPECECRMIKNYYDHAVGLKGFNYCPYCGADMRERREDEPIH